MSANTIAYPFDPTGVATSNRVEGERQVLTPGDWKDHFFLIPLAAPYFGDSLEVILHAGGERELIEGVDYAKTHRFHDASLSIGKPIYGSITFYDKELSGVIEFAYQTLGGTWTQNQNQILTILANKLVNPRITTWEQVAEVPYAFPVINHDYNVSDMVGMTQVVDAIEDVADAIANRQAGGLQEHLDDYNNPHQVTKAQVGLGNVQNYGIANATEAEQGNADNRFMTPLRTRQAITAQAVFPLTTHVDNRNNPHEVTKAQVGLGNVANYGIASTQMAQEGTNNASYMTPANTAAAINTQALVPLNAFIARRDNPNQVTASQVGLGQVQNFPIADATVAQQGVSNAHYMTPASTRVMLNNVVGQDVSDHINNLNNPHQTTKAQVGLGNVQNYPVANEQEATQGSSNSLYMTPLRTSQLVGVMVSESIGAHANDMNNPHQTTKAQVGLGNVENYAVATQQQATDGVSNTTYMTPLRARQAFDVWSADMGGGVPSSHVTDYNNPHQTTAAQVGAYTTAQTDGLLNGKLGSTQTAYDSTRFGGMTVQQFKDSLPTSGVSTYAASALAQTHWTYFGSTPNNQPVIFTLYGASSTDEEPSAMLCEYSPLHSTVPVLRVLCGDFGALEVGYVLDTANSEVDFYLKSPGPRSAFSIHLALYNAGFGSAAPSIVTTEPANYRAFSNLTTLVDTVYQKHGHIGEVVYSDAGTLTSANVLEDVNVVIAADETLAQARTKDWSEIVDEMSPLHFYRQSAPLSNSSDRTIRAFWNYDTSVSLLQQGDIARNFLRGLYSGQGHSSYTFEATFSSSNANMQGGLGVCAALVERNGKYYSIDIVRTPGGMISQTHPGSSFFKLVTVGLNLFRNDTADLGSTSSNQVWGDGVMDADRSTAGTFVPANHGWSNLGQITIRVVKTLTSISIFVSQPNAAIPGTPTVTIDLTTPAMAAIFGGRPTRYGIIASPNATDFSVSFVRAPNRFRPYVKLGSGTDYVGSSFNYFDGQTWVATAAKSIDIPYLNRLLYSEIDGTIWKIGRSGVPRKFYIAAQSSGQQTVFTA